MVSWFPFSFPHAAASAYARHLELSLTCAEIMGRRGLIMMEYALTGNTAHLRELEQMVGEKMAVLPEIGLAFGKECMQQALRSESDAIKMMEASLQPVHTRTRANLSRLRKK
ncbi:MAG: hypothetical protein EBV03_08630 [Proteobacteria bacterium]|nr:hypothetical protein [Pseudomonadota bacterium]